MCWYDVDDVVDPVSVTSSQPSSAAADNRTSAADTYQVFISLPSSISGVCKWFCSLVSTCTLILVYQRINTKKILQVDIVLYIIFIMSLYILMSLNMFLFDSHRAQFL